MYKTDSTPQSKELGKMNSYLIIFVLAAFLLVPSTQSRKISRIIGGQEANAGQFPFAAAINKRTSDGTYFCGGSLLSQEWVLTAGQCVDGAVLFTIYLGTITLTEQDESARVLTTETFVLHPDFNALTLANDIGLIKLRIPITFSDYIRPVDFLPTTELMAYAGGLGLGWGQLSDISSDIADKLNWVRLTVLTDEECRGFYGSQILDNMVCVDGNFNEGICHGDSGGPLIQDLGRGYKLQVAVATFISGNGCESLEPSGYTTVFPYMTWLYNITGM